MSIQREKERGHESDLTSVIAIGPSLPSGNESEERVVRRSMSCSGLAAGSGNDEDNMETCTCTYHLTISAAPDAQCSFLALRPPTLRTPSPGPPISADLSIILEADTSGISGQGAQDESDTTLQPTPSPTPAFRPHIPYDPRNVLPQTPLNAKSPTTASRSSLLPRYTHNSAPPSPLSITTSSTSSRAPTAAISKENATGRLAHPTPLTSHSKLPGSTLSIDKNAAVPPRPSPYFKSNSHLHTRSSSSSISFLPRPPNLSPLVPVVVVGSSSPSSSSSRVGLSSPSKLTAASLSPANPLTPSSTTRDQTARRRLQHKRSVSAFELGSSPSSPSLNVSRASLSLERRCADAHRGSNDDVCVDDVSASGEASADDPGAAGHTPTTLVVHQRPQPPRARKRSMSVQDQSSPSTHDHTFGGRSGPTRRGGGVVLGRGRGSVRVGPTRGGSPVREQHKEEPWDDEYQESVERRASSSLSGRIQARSRMMVRESGPDGAAATTTQPYRLQSPEWLGPRTIKALKAAGLFVSESADGGSERAISSSASVLGGTPGGLGRLAATRSVSEYNSRVPSRTAFSDAGCGYGPSNAGYSGEAWRSSLGRSRSGSDHGVLASPTHTAVSSGSTATATTRERSASTAHTSLSAGSSFFGGRDRDHRDRELGREGSRLPLGDATSPDQKDLKDLKEKHATETGALLHALSDSQRSVRVLREENDGLRVRIGRLEGVERENEGLRRVVVDLRSEVGGLKMRVGGRGSLGGSSSARRFGGAWTTRPSALGTAVPLGRQDMDDTNADVDDLDHGSLGDGGRRPSWRSRDRTGQRRYGPDHDKDLDAIMTFPPPTSSSTPVAISKKQLHARRKRLSTTSTSASSTFPVMPDNMTMLLHDEQVHDPDNSDVGDGTPNHQLHSSATPVPLSIPASVPKVNISPTTTTFSVFSGANPGSPGSMVLKPEDEMHLRDLENLDLGSFRFEEVENESDGW